MRMERCEDADEAAAVAMRLWHLFVDRR